MTPFAHASPLTARLIASLHVEAMVLSDEARSYFDGPGRHERAGLDTVERVYFSCESLKITTRLMHIVAWLLVHRNRLAEGQSDHATPSRLGHADPSDPAGLIALPPSARSLIESSQDLYRRVAQLDSDMHQAPDFPLPGPARALQESLSRLF